MSRSAQMAWTAVQAMDDKKGEEIRIIDISEVSVIADYFLIASGRNRNQIQAMADSVEESMGKCGYIPKNIEGYRAAAWILMDYRDVVIHIFSEEDREFYDLERIWRDGKEISMDALKELAKPNEE